MTDECHGRRTCSTTSQTARATSCLQLFYLQISGTAFHFVQTAGVGEEQRRGGHGSGGGGRSSAALLQGCGSNARHGVPVHQGAPDPFSFSLCLREPGLRKRSREQVDGS